MLANKKCSSLPPSPWLQTYPFPKYAFIQAQQFTALQLKQTRIHLVPKEVSFQLLASVKPVMLIPIRAKCCVTDSPLSLLQKGLKEWVEARSQTGKEVRQLLLLEIKNGEHVRRVFLSEPHMKKCCGVFSPSPERWFSITAVLTAALCITLVKHGSPI